MNEIKQRLRTTHDWMSLLQTLEADAEKLEDRVEKSRRLYVLGQACEEIFLLKKEALAHFKQAYKLNPQDVRPLLRAREIYREMGNLKMIDRLLEFQLRVIGDSVESNRERAALLVEIANSQIDLGLLDQARKSITEALGRDPNAPGLEETLATVSYDRTNWEHVVDSLVIEGVNTGDGDTAARLLLRAARIVALETPNDFSRREKLLRDALSRGPSNSTVSFLLENLLADQNRKDDLMMFHETRVESVPVEQQAALYRALGSWWSTRFDDLPITAAFYRRALNAYYADGADPFPGHLAAFRVVRDVDGAANPTELLDLADLGLLAPLLEEDQIILALLAGEFSQQVLHDRSRAETYFEFVRRADPENPLAAAFFSRETKSSSKKKKRSTEQESKTPATKQAAIVEEKHPTVEEPPIVETPSIESEPAMIVSAPPAIESTVPVETSAVSTSAPTEIAVSSVEEPSAGPQSPSTTSVSEDLDEIVDSATAALIAQAKEAEAKSVENGINAWRKVALSAKQLRTPRRALARLYRQTEKWKPLADILKEEADLLQDTVEKRQRYLEIADIYHRHLNQPRLVINYLNDAHKLDPTDLAILDKLLELHEQNKAWNEVIGTLRKKAEVIADVSEQIALWSRIAELFIERFTNKAEAIKAYEHVLTLDPVHPRALSHLKEMYEGRRDWEKLIAISQQEIDVITDPELKAQRLVEVAQLASTKLKRPQVSTDLWSRVLEIDPTHAEALSELEQLYERAKEWENLATICERQIQNASDRERKSQLLLKLGILFSEKVQDDARAIGVWKQLLEIDPENRRAEDSLKKLYLAARDFDAIEAFYAASQKWEELIRVLERQVDVENPETQIELLFKIARLWATKADKPDRAIRAYERILTIDENHLQAAEALIPLLESGRDSKRYIRVLEIQLDHTDDPLLKQERLQNIASLCEERLREKDQALKWYLKAIELDGREAWAREHAERLAGELRHWPDLVGTYEHARKKIHDPLEALPLIETLARIYEEDLGNYELALTANQEVLELDPQNTHAIAALERLYSNLGRWEDLLSVLQRKLEIASADDERRAIYFKIADLYEEELKNPEKAIETYNLVLDMGGEDLHVLRALDGIYQSLSRWDELALIIDRQLQRLTATDNAIEDIVALKYRLGRLRETQLNDIAGAIECYREILQDDVAPDHDEARHALEQHLTDTQHQLDAARILKQNYALREEWKKLIDATEIELRHTTDPLINAELLKQIGQLWVDRLGDATHGFEAYSRCFVVDPSDEAVRMELERIASIQDTWENLVELYQRAVAETADAPLKHGLLVTLAQISDEQLGDTSRAIGFYRDALTLEPETMSTLDALIALFTKTEQWTELLPIYERKAALLSNADERKLLFAKMAYLWEEMLGNLDEAVRCYSEILAIDPVHDEALRKLERLYQAQRAWPALVENLTKRLELSEDRPERLELMLRLGELKLSELADTVGAIELYRTVLEHEPHNASAVRALETLLLDKTHGEAVAPLLESYYRATNNWEKLITVYEIIVEHSFDPLRKVELLHQIGELYELAGDDSQKAFTVYSRALREDTANERTQQQLERLAEQIDAWKDLIDVYTARVAELSDEALAVSLWFKIALFWQEYLENVEESANAYQRILALDAQNLDAINALENLYIRAENYEALVSVLQKKSESILDAEERKSLLFRIGQIYEEILGRPGDAIDTYRRVLDISDADLRALEALERLYLDRERWQDLREIYQRRIDLAESVEDKKEILYRVATLHEQKLNDLDHAIEAYHAITDLDADDLGALQGLDQLYQRAARWYDLLQILERQAEMQAGSTEAIALRYRIGQIWQHKIADLPRAIETYRELLLLHPTHEETLAALDELVHSDQEPVLAAQVLEPIYESTMEWERLIDLYEVMTAHSDDPLRKTELLHKIAQLQEDRLNNASAAFATYGRILREDNSDPVALESLERLAEQIGLWEPLAVLYEEELEKILDPLRKVDMGLRLARIYDVQIDRSERAVAHYRNVLDADPENAKAISALERLYAQQANWPAFVEILQRQLSIAQTPDDVVELQFRLAETYREHTGNIKGAIDAYREILLNRPDHRQTVAALELLFEEGHFQLEIGELLEPLYREQSAWEKLVRVMQIQLDQLQASIDRAQLIQRIAELCEQELKDFMQAFRWWGQALLEEPNNESTRETLERLAEIVDGWEELTSVYHAAIEKLESIDRIPPLKALARIYGEKLRDLSREEECFLQILELDATDGSALEALDRIYLASGQHEALAAILKRRIENTDDTETLIELQLRLATLYETALSSTDKAIQSYRAALEIDSQNMRALEALERLHFEREAWPELFEVYQKIVDIGSGDAEVADGYARMAKIASDALNDPARARDLWNRVLDLRGEDSIALDALAGLYEAAGEWQDLVEILQRQVHILDDAEKKIAVYKRLGVIWETRLERDRNALESWQNALELDPDNREALTSVARLYERAEEWSDFAETLKRLISVGQDSAQPLQEIKALYIQLAETQSDRLLANQDAIETWRAVLRLDAEEFRAIQALEQLLSDEGRWEELVEVLKQKSAAFKSTEQAIDALLQAATVLKEQLSKRDAAAAIYESVLQQDTTNLAAFTALDEYYQEEHRWEKLIELLLGWVGNIPESNERVALFQRTAKLYEEKLGETENAFVVLQAAFKEDYTNDITASEFQRLASAANKWNELLTDYNAVVQTIADPKIKADLLVKMSRWYGSELGRLDYAQSSLSQALQIDPENVAALGVLAQLYRKTGQWSDLVPVIRRQAELEADNEKQRDLWMSLAEVYEGPLESADKAIAAYNKALALEEHNVNILTALERLYRRQQDWRALVDILIRKANLSDDAETIIELKKHAADLYEDRLNDFEHAIALHKDVLSLEPQSIAALKALERLYEKSHQTQEYLDVLEQQIDLCDSDEDRIAIYKTMATVWEEKQRDASRAAECLEKVLEMDSGHEPAYRELARLYDAERQHENLVDVLRRHAQAITDNFDRIDLYSRIGQVYETALKDADRAIEAYNDILSFDPDHVQALDALARLYEEVESWDRAAETLNHLIQFSDDISQRTKLLYRLARIEEEHLKDADAAEGHYQHVLEGDPKFGMAMLRLAEIYKARGDWAKATKMMVSAEPYISNQLEKVRLLFEAGHAFQTKLKDESLAATMYAQTLALDPDHVGAGEPLAKLYFRDERYQELEPILDMLLRKADKRDHRQLHELHYRLAKTADTLGKSEKALQHYRTAYDLDATDLPTLLGMANLLYRTGDLDGAYKIYQTTLVHHRDKQDTHDVVEIYFRLGEIKRKSGERRKALNMFEKALEEDVRHRPTIEAIIALQTEQNDWDAVVKAKRMLLEVVDTDERFTIHEEIGDIFRDKLDKPDQAIAAYRAALEIRPQSHPILHNLVELYTKTEQWKRVVETILALVAIDTNRKAKAKFYYTAAVVCRDQMRAIDESLDLFNNALDEDPSELKAFEAIERICMQKKDWKQQERCYRKMIKRLGQDGDAALLTMLWHNLGEIYRSRLNDFPSAITAFEVAAKLEPQNQQRHEILAELYLTAGTDYADKAIAEHQTLIQQSPYKIESYKALRKIYMETKRYDQAWCVCATLNFLKKADTEEQQFYQQYKQRGFVRAKSRMSDEMWHKFVFHPSEDLYVGAVFGLLGPVIATQSAQPHRKYGLKRKERVDLATDQLLFSKVFNYVTSVLNVIPAELYLQPQRPFGMQMAHTEEVPSFVVGANLLSGRPEKELAFEIGKQLTYLRPEHFLRLILPAEAQLKVVMFVALRLFNPQFPVPAEFLPEVEKSMKRLGGKIPTDRLEQLGRVVRSFLSGQRAIDLRAWLNGIDLTASRAGLIVCNDLEVAAKIVSNEPAGLGSMPPKDKLKELVLYSISEPYFKVRAQLELSITSS